MQVSVRLTSLVVATVLLAVSPVISNAQALAVQAARPASTASKRITIHVVVDANNSKPPTTVGGLQQQDFTVLDNKVPRPLTSFRAVSGGQEPARVVVLIDAVNIRLQGLAYERDQLSAFLRAHGGKLAHPTAIAILTDNGLKMQNDFSTDGNGISESLQKQDIGMRFIGRSTGIYGAEDRFGLSLDGLRTLATRAAGLPGRTVVLWISPGWPLLSGPGIELSDKQEKQIFGDIVSLSTQLRESRVTLYAIDPIGANEGVGRTFYYQEFLKGISKPSQVDVGDLGLQVLAIQSGGMALNSNDTGALLQRCFADLDNYYEISFEPPPAETHDVYHHLEVTLDKPGITGRTRYGYYSQP
jgi:VWFA-related protein